MPAPARCVSIACRRGESSSPIAAAMPPCAQSVAAPLPERVLHSTVTRVGASLSAAIKPGDAGADDDRVAAVRSAQRRAQSRGRRLNSSMRSTAARARSATSGAIVTSYSIASRLCSTFGSVLRFMCGQRLHGRTNSTLGILARDVVGHRALGHEQHARRRSAACSSTRPTYSTMPCVEPTKSASASTSGGHSGCAITTSAGRPRESGGCRRR